MQGDDIVKAEPQIIQDSNGNMEYVVALELSDDAAEVFAEATKELQGEVISIWMDDVMISYPTVNEAITDGKCTIQGGWDQGFTAEEASDLATKISAGALPFALKTESFSTVNPTLGMSSPKCNGDCRYHCLLFGRNIHDRDVPLARRGRGNFASWAGCIELCGGIWLFFFYQ